MFRIIRRGLNRQCNIPGTKNTRPTGARGIRPLVMATHEGY